MTNLSLDIDALRSSLQSVRATIAKLAAAGAGEDVLEPLRRGEAQLQQQIDTGGGAAVGGSVFTAGGPFIGRDYQRVEVASGAFFVSGDIHGLTVVNEAGQQQRLAPEQAQPDKLLEVYHRWLAEECRRLPLGVIDAKFVRTNVEETVPLPDVYVDLDVIPSTPQEEETKRGWALRLARAATEGGGRIPALDALAEQTRAVLIGDAGSGKTTFVNYLTYLLAQPGSPTAGALPEALRGRLALRLVLREAAADHIPADSEQGDAEMLWRAVEADMARPLGKQAAAILLPYVQQRLWSEGGVMLLDGLDEVPAANRRRHTLLQAVASLTATLPETAGRILVTARPYAYADPQWRLEGFVTLALAPFDEGQQTRFVQRWHQAARPAMGWSEETAQLKGQDLQEALAERPYLADLATRPLLLTLMATVHSSRGSLPEDRADLYEQTIDLLLDRWQKERIVKRGDGEVVEPGIRQVLNVGQESVRVALQRLAYAAHDAQRQEEEGREAEANISEGQVLVAFKPVLGKVHPDELLAYLDQRAGLLIAREPGVYAFPHRSIQEYLAACHLSGQLDFKARVRRLIEEDMPWWREVLLLSILRRDLGSAVHFMEELLPRWRPKQPPDSTDWRMVGLLGEAAVELRLVEWIKKGEDYSGLLADIRDWLERLVDGGRLTPAERLAAGDALGKLGDTRPGVGLVEGVMPPLPDIAWVAIPEGSFTMGSDELDTDAYDDERPAHPVDLPLFYIARYPVTNAQFRPFVEGDGYDNPDYWTREGWAWRDGAEADLSPIQDVRDEDWKRRYAEWLARRPKERRNQPWYWDDPQWNGANRPVVGVSWHEALAFCRWLDARLRAAGSVLRVEGRDLAIPPGYHVHLPSEAEWEKAARGGDGRLWPWPDGWQEERANTKEAGLEQISPVGIFPDGRSAHGLLDMAGNVYEWTRSKWGRSSGYRPDYGYPYNPADGREDLDGSDLRIVRGGSWYAEQKFARCAYRGRLIPDLFGNDRGFGVGVSLANSGF